MNTLVLILQTIRPSSNHGGSSKIVKHVCGELAHHGHHVTLLCAATIDNHDAFDLASGVRVRPELPFRQSWQDTWLVPPADLARIIMTTADHAQRADRLLIFDSHFLYPDVLPLRTPIVWSLRDFVYVQALQGSMTFRRDLLIVPSTYVRNAFCDAVGGWLPGIEDRVITIRNGVDLEQYAPRDTSTARQRLGVQDGPVLLFPHRPEEAKGLERALELCRRFASGPLPNVKLLILRGTDIEIMPEVRRFYVGLERRVEELGLTRNVVFSDWVAPDHMPEVYAAANVTLCIGNIVEASSNTALESVACGTPVVASDIACYREFPEAIRKVPVHDLEAAERTVLRLLTGLDSLDVVAARQELQHHYSYSAMLNGFRETIETCTVQPPLVPKVRHATVAKIPTWISMQGNSLYDEYRKTRLVDPTLQELWSTYGHAPFDVKSAHVSDGAQMLLRSGALVLVK